MEQMMKMLSGLLEGTVDIDDLATKAANEAPPPNIQGIEGMVDEGSEQMTGEPENDPMANLLKLLEEKGGEQAIKPPEVIQPKGMPMGGGKVGGAPATKAALAAVPQMPAMGTNLMTNLKGAFK